MANLNYAHLEWNGTTHCPMGEFFSMYQMSLEPLKLCDRCDKPIKIRELPKTTSTPLQDVGKTGKVSEDPLINAAFLYGPGGLPLPGQKPSTGPAGPLTG